MICKYHLNKDQYWYSISSINVPQLLTIITIGDKYFFLPKNFLGAVVYPASVLLLQLQKEDLFFLSPYFDKAEIKIKHWKTFSIKKRCIETKSTGFANTPEIFWPMFRPILFRTCHVFRFKKQDGYFWVNLDHFWIEHSFMRHLG